MSLPEQGEFDDQAAFERVETTRGVFPLCPREVLLFSKSRPQPVSSTRDQKRLCLNSLFPRPRVQIIMAHLQQQQQQPSPTSTTK